jgi:hypothetical protein
VAKTTADGEVNGSVLVAPCGMNCTLCASYQALKNDVNSKGLRISTCKGCRPRNKQCAFIKKRCPKMLKGEVKFCFECTDFPCHTLETLSARYKVRYRMSMIENLQCIKEKGMAKFLKAQAEQWRCSRCGGTICCHNGLCFNCDLEQLKSRTKKYYWVDAATK